MGIEQGEEFKFKSPDNNFNTIIEENILYLKQEMLIKIQEAYKTPNRLNCKRKSPYHIVINTLNIQNRERVLKATKTKDQVRYKSRLIRLKPYVSTKSLKTRKTLTDALQTPRDHK